MNGWQFKEWVDFLPQFLSGQSITKLPPFTRSRLGAMLNPAAREPRQRAHAQWQNAKARLEILKAGDEPLKARMGELRRELKRQTAGVEDMAEEDKHPDLRRLELTVKSAVDAYDKNRLQIRDIEDNMTKLEFEEADELDYRAALALAQIKALRKFLDEKERHYELVAAFKRFELKCEDRDTYYAILAKLLKYLEVHNSIDSNWIDLLPMPPEERDDWPPVYHRGGFINQAALPQTTSIPQDIHAKRRFMKAFWEGVDTSDLHAILGLDDD